ncbi:MAG: substrate-binding domain-containing protein [Erysipelotrichaceae bacterium]|nr:substrate-binding domain-containing protein [Erysipelotrichaceae bacterium]
MCSFDHPLSKYDEVTVEQLDNEEFILLSQNYGYQFYQDFMEACKQDGLNLKIKKEEESFDSLVFDVSIGEGIAIVSSDVVRKSEVKVISLKNSHHHSRYVIAYLDKLQDQQVQNLINSILEYFNLYNK